MVVWDFFRLVSAQIIELFYDEGLYYIVTSPLIYTANQWAGFYMIGSSVMKDCERKGNDYLLEMRLVLISNYSATFSTNKKTTRT